MVDAAGHKTILITGATGKQGGAVLRHLRGSGFTLRAFTRDPDSDAARGLAVAGVELVQGDLNDQESVRAAVAGVCGVYSVQNSIASLAAEIAQGKRLAELAAAAGVRHFVYSSAAWADRNSGIPHCESKWEIERHIQALGLPATVIRPVFFMQNWERQRQGIAGGVLSLPVAPQTRLHQISVDDIGAFAARVFHKPQQYIGRAIDLAGDVMSMREAAAIFSTVIGRPVTYIQSDWAGFEARMGRELTLMYRFFERAPVIGAAALLAEVPAASTLDGYLRKTNWGAAPRQAVGALR